MSKTLLKSIPSVVNSTTYAGNANIAIVLNSYLLSLSNKAENEKNKHLLLILESINQNITQNEMCQVIMVFNV